jgi:opacity protein-like surface antigen
MLARPGLALVLSLLCAHVAYAQPAGATTYGKRGTMEVEAGVGVGFPLTVPDHAGASSPLGDVHVGFAPAFRYFVLDGFAVGGTVGVGYTHLAKGLYGNLPSTGWSFDPATKDLTVLHAALGFEYNLRLRGRIVPYGAASAGVEYYTGSQTVVGTTFTFSDTAFLLDLGAGVKIAVARHLVVGVGLDVPMTFHTHEAFYYFNLLGRLAYTF